MCILCKYYTFTDAEKGSKGHIVFRQVFGLNVHKQNEKSFPSDNKANLKHT